MPSYKLTYFGVRGRGELIRLVFEAAGKTYENEVVQFADWPALKPKMPTGQLPLLEVDGKKLSQSMAIARYLAREFNLGGANNLEQAQIDQVIETTVDGLTEYVKYYFEKDEDKKAEAKKKFVDETMPKFANILTTFLESSGGSNGFFVGPTLTIADLAAHEIVTDFLKMNPDALKDFPKLAANRKAVEANENVRRYLEKRTDSDI